MYSSLKEKLLWTVIEINKNSMRMPSQVNLHISELFAMEHLASEDTDASAISSAQLQEKLRINKSAVSQTLTRLEQKGYVERKTSTNDRRRSVITLTKVGEAAMKKMRFHVESSIDEIILRFGEEKTEQLIDLCAEFSNIFKQMRNEKILEKNGKDCDDETHTEIH